MPNLRSANVSKDGISLVAADGRAFSLTRAQILAFYQTTTGNAATRLNATKAWVRTQLETTLGETMLPAAWVTFDFSPTDANQLLTLEVTEVP